MLEVALEYLEKAAAMISLVAVAVIVVGFALAAVRAAFRSRQWAAERKFQSFKIELGSALMLGLEIIVLADIIETITVEPTFQSLALLAFLVVARTIVSWTLTLEIEGHWPWQGCVEGSGELNDA